MNLKELKQSKYLVGVYLNEMKDEKHFASCMHGLANQTLPVDVILLTRNLSKEDLDKVVKICKKPYISYLETDADTKQLTEKIIESEKSVNFNILEVDEDLNFSKIFNKLFNLALKNDYEAISITEKEDGYSVKWFEIVDKYISENPEVSIFTPLIKNVVNGVFSGVMNESPWVEGMSEEAGKFDLNLLQRFNCANPLGAVYKVSALEEYSEKIEDEFKPMKESMKISHYYEFFLRMIYDDIKMLTIPRIGYEINIIPKEEFSDSSCKIPQNIALIPAEKGGLTSEEARFWFELAKKEFFYEEDRKKVYELSE